MARKAQQNGSDLGDSRAELVSVVKRGETTYALILVPGELVADLGLDVELAPPARVVNATEAEIERLRESSPDLADGALAASIVTMALALENPYTSATAQSYCQARLADGLRELRALVPPKEKQDAVDEIAAARARRRSATA